MSQEAIRWEVEKAGSMPLALIENMVDQSWAVNDYVPAFEVDLLSVRLEQLS
jgi:hypothetical protein